MFSTSITINIEMSGALRMRKDFHTALYNYIFAGGLHFSVFPIRITLHEKAYKFIVCEFGGI